MQNYRLRCFLSIVSALSFILGSTPVNAQMCFRGKPSPECKSFWITEFGLCYRIDPVQEMDMDKESLTMELGYMVNHTAKSAFGGTFFLRGGEPMNGLGLRPRYRRWLTTRTSLDLSPGIVLVTWGDFDTAAPTFSGQIALNGGDWVGITLQADVIRYDYPYSQQHDRTDLAWYAGARFGSYPGVVGTVVFLGLAILIAATWD